VCTLSKCISLKIEIIPQITHMETQIKCYMLGIMAIEKNYKRIKNNDKSKEEGSKWPNLVFAHI
jgi:NifU-like protein involved in Fe-S cluster formation